MRQIGEIEFERMQGAAIKIRELQVRIGIARQENVLVFKREDIATPIIEVAHMLEQAGFLEPIQ